MYQRITHRFHDGRAWLLFGLCAFDTGEETSKETRLLFLRIHVKIFVVVDLSWCKFPTLCIWSSRRLGVQSFIDNSHSLENENAIGLGQKPRLTNIAPCGH